MGGKSNPQEFIIRRQIAVLKLNRKGMTTDQIVQKLPKKFKSPCKKTVDTDLANIRAGMLKYAMDLLGDQRQAVADFISKSIELQRVATIQGDFRLVYQINKDLLKFVGINLDKIEIGFDFGENEGGGPMTFIEVMNQIRNEKQLPPVDSEDV